MKKTWKRLCMGFLALATVVTAKQIKGKNRLVSKDLLSNGKGTASYPL